MSIDEKIKKRFSDLDIKTYQIQALRDDESAYINRGLWEEWATSVMDLFENNFGVESVYSRRFREIDINFHGLISEFERAKGIFKAARSDYEDGYISRLEKVLSGEILVDFINLAKASLKEGNKDVASVLACAALEDSLKRYARQNNLSVEDKPIQEVVSALKAKGLVSGAQKSLLDTMPKLRDYAMHANWDKLTDADAGSIIGFVEQFVISKFS